MSNRVVLTLLSVVFFSACLSRREILERQAEEEDKDLAINELKAADAAGKPLAGDVVLERLKTACEQRNHRPACLGFVMNHFQRTGQRENVAAATHQMLKTINTDEWREWKFGYALSKCADSTDDWESCYEARARFTTYFPWAMASGNDFSKVFPQPSGAAGERHAAYQSLFPQGRGFTCFRTTEMGVCFRNANVCEQARVKDFANLEPGPCKPHEGLVFTTNPHEPMVMDQEACEALAKMGDTTCWVMGNFQH